MGDQGVQPEDTLMGPDLPDLRRELAGRSVTEREEYYDRHHLSPEDRDRIEASLTAESAQTSAWTSWRNPSAADNANAPTTFNVVAPQTVGRYQLIRLLGRGGMGEVYLARDPVLDREIALKVLGVQFDDAESRKRIVREARAAGRLRHPNIVTVFDAGEDNGRSYIAMEYVPGETLGGLIRRRAPLSIARKLELIEGACSGLAHAHRISVVHLDIKPENLMLDESGTVRVLDFGIARVLMPDVEATRSVAGTLRYMSPEQLQGRPLDRRSDIFSLGCSLFELASGVPAYSGSTHEVVTRITGGPIPRLIEVAPEIDPRLDALVFRSMALDADGRHADMDELRADLAGLRGHLDASADRLSPQVLIPSTAPGTGDGSRSRSINDSVTARPFKRVALWTGVSLVFGLMVALGLWTFRAQDPVVANQGPAIVAAAPPLNEPTPSAVVPKAVEKTNQPTDEVWRLLASDDRQGVLRRLRSNGASSLKTGLASEVVEAVRGAAQRTRLSANDRSATESTSYRLGEERLAQANRLAADRPLDALVAFWEAGDFYRQSTRADMPAPQIPTTGQIPLPPPGLPPGLPSPPPQQSVDATRAAPASPAPAVTEPVAVGRPAPDPGVASPRPSDEDAILEVLRRYERAYETLNVVAVQQVYPGLAGKDVEDLRRTFAGLAVYDVDIRNPRVTVQNATATVRALIARRFVPKVGNPVDSAVQNEFQLRRERDTWVIIAIKVP